MQDRVLRRKNGSFYEKERLFLIERTAYSKGKNGLFPKSLACIIHTAYAVLWKNQIKQGKTNKNLFSLVFDCFLLFSSRPR